MGPQPQSSALVEEQEKRLAKPERLFHEINLLHLEGHYFAFDPKAANVFPDPMKSVEKRLANPKINAEHPIEVIPHPGYGKPSVFAYKGVPGDLEEALGLRPPRAGRRLLRPSGTHATRGEDFNRREKLQRARAGP